MGITVTIIVIFIIVIYIINKNGKKNKNEINFINNSKSKSDFNMFYEDYKDKNNYNAEILDVNDNNIKLFTLNLDSYMDPLLLKAIDLFFLDDFEGFPLNPDDILYYIKNYFGIDEDRTMKILQNMEQVGVFSFSDWKILITKGKWQSIRKTLDNMDFDIKLYLKHLELYDDEDVIIKCINLLSNNNVDINNFHQNIQLEFQINYNKALKVLAELNVLGIISENINKNQFLLTKQEVEKIVRLTSKEEPPVYEEKINKEYEFPTIDLIKDENNQNINTIENIILSEQFKNTKSEIPFILGIDNHNNYVIEEIEKLQNIIIVSEDKKDKLNCIKNLITSIIYKSKPDKVKLVMTDIEEDGLSIYNKTPFLIIPILTDFKKSVGALAWAEQECKNRLSCFEINGVKDLENYNKIIKNEQGITLPKLVVVINIYIDNVDYNSVIKTLLSTSKESGIYLIIISQNINNIPTDIQKNIPIRMYIKDKKITLKNVIKNTSTDIQQCIIPTEIIENIINCIENDNKI